MKILKPKALKKGDTVGLLSPASATPHVDYITKGIKALEQLGFQVKEAKYARDELGFLAGDDSHRLADLHALFRDRSVKAIMCFRGGYGAGRLLPQLNYELIARNPKILIGFSDITALHLALWKECRLITFHGPMATSHLGRDNCPEFTVNSLLRCITEPTPFGSLRKGSRVRSPLVLRKGTAQGRTIGGNLALCTATVGTPWEIDTKNKIVILEDVDEKPYRLDRMLTQLLQAGKLWDAAGIAIGICTDCKAKPHREGYWTQSAEDVFSERLEPLKIPVLMGLPFGHLMKIATVPLGVKATLDTEQGDLIIDETAVQ